MYEARTFVDKNKDVLLLDLTELWESSSLDLLKRVYPEDGSSATTSSKSTSTSQSSQFKSQVWSSPSPPALLWLLGQVTLPHMTRLFRWRSWINSWRR